MGSFNLTCAISGLPIPGGTKVRYFLLTEAPDKKSAPVYIHEVWGPRNFPLKATYNDYGTVEKVEEGPARDAWMLAFKRDLVEVGQGDNSYHDLPTSKDMTFDHLLHAIRERRVMVQRNYRSIYMERLFERIDQIAGGAKRGEQSPHC